MRFNAIALQTAAIAVALLSTGAARADSSPLGIWIDHTGRGAVEIVNCGDKLCGFVAWVKDAKDAEGCGEKIIGDVKSVGGGKWDNGWIWDPDSSSKYDVELTPMGDQMRVVGYAGTKWLSETYTWKRAPADLKKCSKAAQATDTPASKPADTPAPKPAADATPVTPKEQKVASIDPVTPAPAAPAPEAKKTAEVTPEAGDAPVAKSTEPAPKTKQAKKKDGPNAATLVARMVEAMDDEDDGASKPEKTRAKKNCKMEVPYLDMVVSYACD
jgi:uncharacterized protein (DUF2147 family)